MKEKPINRLYHAEDLPDVLTMAHVAMALGCSLSKAYSLLRLKDFPRIVIGSRIYINKGEFLMWIDSQIGKGG